MKFNREKLELLERRAIRLRGVSSAAGDRQLAARDSKLAAEAELARQRAGMKPVGGGVQARFVRLLREAVEKFDRAREEYERESAIAQEAGQLFERCVKFLLDEHGIDVRQQRNHEGDYEIVHSPDANKGPRRSAVSQYIDGREVQR